MGRAIMVLMFVEFELVGLAEVRILLVPQKHERTHTNSRANYANTDFWCFGTGSIRGFPAPERLQSTSYNK
ncbi:hypothetical protein BC937DRAFT_94796 [Endogone sp. FLAS-F59071]|nr:hypothetical protein BC937DRAFT_94796 [Endogone sp. FLAS-F59071]|eukprot:RUS22942.1 hypothetical protein BC937DRAFT_94796 [Endogone sp. FLAS-F59071]